MRVDALFRLIVAMFIASLPLLLAIQRSRRERVRRTAVQRESGPESEQQVSSQPKEEGAKEHDQRPRRRGRFQAFLHRMFETEPDEDLRERPRRPSPARLRRRPGAATEGEPQRRRRIPSPTGDTAKWDRPESGYKQGAATKASTVSRPRKQTRAERGAQALVRVEKLPLLQRAIAYQEILGTPRGLRDPGSPDPPGTREF